MLVGAWRRRGGREEEGGKGCEVGWEGSAAGCRPGHTTCLPDVPRPAVAPGLGAGSSTLVRAQLECCGNVLCRCVCDCAYLCGEALAHRRPTVILCGRPFLEPPLPPLNSPLPHPLCPLARHVLTQQPAQIRTHKTYARTGRMHAQA